mmetsp:Transcript_25566/g.66079  ORF Transcript_25566/g.66079 Transcript_25566/m.66079 type:complete len:328 (-) Transcript_25566:235-1218(-)
MRCRRARAHHLRRKRLKPPLGLPPLPAAGFSAWRAALVTLDAGDAIVCSATDSSSPPLAALARMTAISEGLMRHLSTSAIRLRSLELSARSHTIWGLRKLSVSANFSVEVWSSSRRTPLAYTSLATTLFFASSRTLRPFGSRHSVRAASLFTTSRTLNSACLSSLTMRRSLAACAPEMLICSLCVESWRGCPPATYTVSVACTVAPTSSAVVRYADSSSATGSSGTGLDPAIRDQRTVMRNGGLAPFFAPKPRRSFATTASTRSTEPIVPSPTILTVSGPSSGMSDSFSADGALRTGSGAGSGSPPLSSATSSSSYSSSSSSTSSSS